MSEIQEIMIKRAKDKAVSRGGLCLTTEYINVRTKMDWKCMHQDHPVWQATFKNVVYGGRWCNKCRGSLVAMKLKHHDGLKAAKDYAQSKGGDCLSSEYERASVKLIWTCSNQEHNSWQSTFNNVVHKGKWCSLCSAKKRVSENRVRLIFEEFFGCEFPTAKPTWNINPCSGRLLELDGYSEKLRIAFEHNGEQHFKPSFFIKDCSVQDLIYQLYKDATKDNNCKEQGIELITITILDEKHRNDFHKFVANVKQCCKAKGISMKFSCQQLQAMKLKFFAI